MSNENVQMRATIVFIFFMHFLSRDDDNPRRVN